MAVSRSSCNLAINRCCSPHLLLLSLPFPRQLLQADTFDLHSFHTLTGTTFMLLAEPQTPDAAELLRTT